MIARVAESCFWLHRYVERVDNTARLLAVNFAFALDEPIGTLERWRPLLVVSGIEPTFREHIGAEHFEDGSRVRDFLTWDAVNPVSLRNSLKGARENARTIRETLSLESWTVLNRFWLWFESREAQRLYRADPPVFFERVRESCHLFHGVCNDTLLHEEPYEFMRLGMYLERAGQTARIVDTKHHALGPTRAGPESSAEAAEWIAILRSCSAYDPFFRRSEGPLSGRNVADFLLLEPSFPRSVRHCLERAWNFTQLILAGDAERRASRSANLMIGLLTRLRATTIDEVLDFGMHEELTAIIDRLAEICNATEAEFFTWREFEQEMLKGAPGSVASGSQLQEAGSR
jgi:uncharacterized alpha-E superfamily protein